MDEYVLPQLEGVPIPQLEDEGIPHPPVRG